MIYQNKLNPGNGLFLEIYGHYPIGKKGIKYIEITILKEMYTYQFNACYNFFKVM